MDEEIPDFLRRQGRRAGSSPKLFWGNVQAIDAARLSLRRGEEMNEERLIPLRQVPGFQWSVFGL